MVKDKKHESLSKEVLDEVNEVLSQYFEQDVCAEDVSDGESWEFNVKTKWLYSNRGIFRTVVTRYYISASVIRHQFDSEANKYRNGKVYRIYPDVSWEYYTGGSNGHTTEPEMIIIEKMSGNWRHGLTLNGDE